MKPSSRNARTGGPAVKLANRALSPTSALHERPPSPESGVGTQPRAGHWVWLGYCTSPTPTSPESSGNSGTANSGAPRRLEIQEEHTGKASGTEGDTRGAPGRCPAVRAEKCAPSAVLRAHCRGSAPVERTNYKEERETLQGSGFLRALGHHPASGGWSRTHDE